MASEPELRKCDFATRYVFTVLMALQALQWAWADCSQIETTWFSQFEQLISQGRRAIHCLVCGVGGRFNLM